jgi:zinc transporter ZupT
VRVTPVVAQPYVSQVIFLRDTASTRIVTRTSLQEAAAPHVGLADAPALVEIDCRLHDNCDDCGHGAHAHSHGDHFSWLLDTHALGPKALVPLLLTIVLSVHSFIAGMALGVQESSAAAVPTLIAIVAHKWVEAISLGVSVVRVTPDRRALLRYAAAASCSTSQQAASSANS